MSIDDIVLRPPQRRLLERLVANIDGPLVGSDWSDNVYLPLEVVGSELAPAKRLAALGLADFTAGTNAAKARPRGVEWLEINPRRGRRFAGPGGYTQVLSVRLKLKTEQGLEVLASSAGYDKIPEYVRGKLEQLVEDNRKIIEVNLRAKNPRRPAVDE